MITHLGHGLLAATTANTHTVDNISLLSLISHAASLVRSARACEPHNAWQLPKLPASYAKEEAEHIALLLFPELFNILHTEREMVEQTCTLMP